MFDRIFSLYIISSSYKKAVLNEGCVIKQSGPQNTKVWFLLPEKKKNINAVTAASEFFS